MNLRGKVVNIQSASADSRGFQQITVKVDGATRPMYDSFTIANEDALALDQDVSIVVTPIGRPEMEHQE